MFTRVLNNIEVHKYGEILENIAGYVDNKMLKSTQVINKPFNLENIVEAHQKLERGEVIGKLTFDRVDEF